MKGGPLPISGWRPGSILYNGFPLNLLIALFHWLQEGSVWQIIDELIDFRLQQDFIHDWLADQIQKSPA